MKHTNTEQDEFCIDGQTFCRSGHLRLCLALAGILVATSCTTLASEETRGSLYEETGSFRLAVSQKEGDTIYRLRNAQFEISGPIDPILVSSEDTDRDTIELELPVGNDFRVELIEPTGKKFHVERTDKNGTQEFRAILTSDNPKSFSVQANTKTPVAFSLELDSGKKIDLEPPGSIEIEIDISQPDDSDDSDDSDSPDKSDDNADGSGVSDRPAGLDGRIPSINATYYVDPNGNNNNDGSKGAPFKTIQKAANVVQPGDVVVVRDGIYTKSSGKYIVTLLRGGTETKWITFRSENRWRAVLDGNNNKIHDCWLFGPNANYVRIEYFEVRKCKASGFKNTARAHHIYFLGNNIHHIGNESVISKTGTPGRVGIYQGARASHHTYDGNIFHHIGRFPHDKSVPNHDYTHDHGIYTNAANTTTIINNVFYQNKAGFGVAVGTSTRNQGLPVYDFYIANNIFLGSNPVRTGEAIIVKNDARNVHINNNIFYRMNQAATLIRNDSEAFMNYNIIYPRVPLSLDPRQDKGNWPKPKTRGKPKSAKGNIYKNPRFSNLKTLDLTLGEGSPGINAGTRAHAPDYDYYGVARPSGEPIDIGIHESTSE